MIQLKRPQDYRPGEGARFEVHFSKARAVIGAAAEPFEAQLTKVSERYLWTWRPLEDELAQTVTDLSKRGLTQREIAKEVGIGLGSVNRALTRGRVAPGVEL